MATIQGPKPRTAKTSPPLLNGGEGAARRGEGLATYPSLRHPETSPTPVPLLSGRPMSWRSAPGRYEVVRRYANGQKGLMSLPAIAESISPQEERLESLMQRRL